MNFNDYRLRVMDYLLHSGRMIGSRQAFVNMVNDRVIARGGEEIGEDMLSKNIKALNELSADEEVKIRFSSSKGYHYTKPGYRVFEDFITDEEKKLFTIATNVFNVFSGTPLQEKFSKAVKKVVAETASGSLTKIAQQAIAFGSGQANSGAKWITPLLNAIIEERAIEMTYKSIRYEQPKTKIISPYLLKQYLDRWYLVAYDHSATHENKTLLFSLNGIQDLKEVATPYYSDPGFNPQDYFKYSIGVWHWYDRPPEKVELIFSDYIEMVLLNPIHHSQRSTLSDGGKKLHIEIEVYPSPELETLIKGFGAQVKVIKPLWLADKIRDAALSVADLYPRSSKSSD